MVDYVNKAPERRAGIGQIFLNNVDDAIADALWCKENGLRGGVLIGAVPPTATWIKPLYHPDYDELWAACAENNIPVNAHSGTGGPKYEPAPAMPLVHFLEIPYYSQRPLVHMVLAGVFEKHPKLKFAITETGCAWIPPLLESMDGLLNGMRSQKVGEMRFEGETIPPRSATEYFHQSCWVGISQPTPADIKAGLEVVGIEKMMWGSDYPHEEGTHPFTREHIRQVMGHLKPEQIQQILAGNAAEFYNFDMKALQPYADKYGPTVAEIAEPLTELPANPNQALERAAAQLSKAG